LDIATALALAVIIGSIVLSAWKKNNFVGATAIACAVVFGISAIAENLDQLSFHPSDLMHPAMAYTLLTSMYAHLTLSHILFNMLALVLIGIILEQRIGTRPFMLLYFISGLIGTLAFAVSYWGDQYSAVVGASGAISGVLGGLARLYPNERMAFIFLPTVPMRMWTVVLLFVLLQFVFVFGGQVAWQSHLAGLAAGILAAPLAVKMKPQAATRRGVSIEGLRKLAVTPELKGILSRIEGETVPDVRKAWIEHFLSKARCPICGSPIKVTRDSVRCSRGHLL
jgi:membrane associated rhomboid family serine protease